MTEPTFRTIKPYTPAGVRDDLRTLSQRRAQIEQEFATVPLPPGALDRLRDLIWFGLGIELKIIDVPLRKELAAARARDELRLESHGGTLGPCPWAKGAPERVGAANPGIV